MQLKYLWYLTAGLLSGVLGGMGMGGGTILIPVLTIIFNTPQQIAQAANLITFIPMAIVAVIIHIKNKLIDFKGVIYIIICGCLTGILGAFITKNMDGNLLKKIFGGFLILLALFQGITGILKKK